MLTEKYAFQPKLNPNIWTSTKTYRTQKGGRKRTLQSSICSPRIETHSGETKEEDGWMDGQEWPQKPPKSCSPIHLPNCKGEMGVDDKGQGKANFRSTWAIVDSTIVELEMQRDGSRVTYSPTSPFFCMPNYDADRRINASYELTQNKISESTKTHQPRQKKRKKEKKLFNLQFPV